MVDGDEIYREFLKGLLRVSQVSQGADICDRCGEPIWPEFELVRCDFCIGKHGEPPQKLIQAAYEKHKKRILAVQREELREE